MPRVHELLVIPYMCYHCPHGRVVLRVALSLKAALGASFAEKNLLRKPQQSNLLMMGF